MSFKSSASKYLLEILSIFIGITLSFVFDNFREDHKAKVNRNEILTSLVVDLEIKVKEVEVDKKAFAELTQTIDSALTIAENAESMPENIVRHLYFAIGNDYSYFDDSTPTFISLSQTGIWQSLPDSVRRAVFQSYKVNFRFLQLMYNQLTNHSTFLQEHYLAENALLYRNGTTPNLSLITKSLKEPRFRSALLLIRNQYANTIPQMDITIRDLERLIIMIKSMTNK